MSARRTLCLLAATLPWLVSAGRIPAQDPKKPEVAKPAKTLDVSYVTDDFFAAVVIQPSRLMTSPALKGLLVADFAKGMQEQLGIEPQQIEQVMLLLPRDHFGSRIVVRVGEVSPSIPLGLAGIVRFREAVVNKELLARIGKALGYGELEQVERAGKTYWKAAGRIDVAAYAPDERTLVFAPERRLTSMAFSLAPGGRFISLLKKTDASPDVLVVVEPSAIREAMLASGEFRGEFSRGPESLIGGLVLQILRRVESYTFSADLSTGSRLRWEIVATSPEDAELLHDLIRGWQAALKLALPTLLDAMRDDGAGGMEGELKTIAGRLLTEVLAGIKTSRTDDRVVMQLESKGGHVELFTLAAKAVAAARLEGPIAQSTNNLKQLALAMHNYHDTFRGLPPHASYEKEVKEAPKPLLSWRVHILPFVEQSQLYEKFHFNEPWDSDHNKKLIENMPAIYKSPGLEQREGKTCYVVPVSDDAKYATIFPPGATDGNRRDRGPVGLSLVTIPDGTSNTLMILEVPADKAVTWTKPDDWEVNIKEPKKGLFGARRGFMLVAFGDGSVQRISEKVSAESLRRLFGRQDGEVVDRDEVIFGSRSGHVPGSSDKRPAASSPFGATVKKAFDEPKATKEFSPKELPPKLKAFPPDRKE